MTRDDIICVAREFGWAQKDIDSLLYIVETAVAAEREACAKVCDGLIPPAGPVFDLSPDLIAAGCAAAIRARGQQ